MRFIHGYAAAALAASIGMLTMPIESRDLYRDRTPPPDPAPRPAPRSHSPNDWKSWRESPRPLSKRQKRRLRGKES